MPLNGRSFSSLIELAPGVVLTPANAYEQGQFSVNGQRPDANYFMVDGVSANLGNAGSGGLFYRAAPANFPRPTRSEARAISSRSMPWKNSAFRLPRLRRNTDALRARRSRWLRSPAQTHFHGTAFEYFRNDKLDANDWFANAKASGEARTAAERFRRRLGGPIRKDKLFFFGSYEGLRVRQPHVANTYVPISPRARTRLPQFSRC